MLTVSPSRGYLARAHRKVSFLVNLVAESGNGIINYFDLKKAVKLVLLFCVDTIFRQNNDFCKCSE